MFFRRGLGAPDPWLKPKLWLFTLGALLALLGMALESEPLIGVAGAALAAGLLIRFLPAPQDREEDEPSPRRPRSHESRDEGPAGDRPEGDRPDDDRPDDEGRAASPGDDRSDDDRP